MGYFYEMRRRPAVDVLEMEDAPLLRMPPFATITGFRDGVTALSGSQVERVKSVADFVGGSWRGTSAITSIRIAGYINSREADASLGKKRADAVVDAMLRALGAISATLAGRLFWIVEDRGYDIADSAAKVEIYLWGGPTAPPVPPLVRKESPAEIAARRARPETLDEKIQRILRTTPPAQPRGRSFNDVFWKRFDEHVDATMERMRVPRAIRGPLRKGVQGAVKSGSEAVLDQVLKAADLSDATRKAIKGTVQRLMQERAR